MLIAEKEGKFCIVRRIKKSGMSLGVQSFCGEEGFTEVQQLPDEFLPKLHDECQAAWHETKKAAG